MNFAVATAFSSSPLSTTLLRHYLFLSHNLDRIRQDLIRHQQEQESIFDVLSHSAPFQDIITPIVLDFRYRQRQVSLVNPPPILRTPSPSPISEHMTERRSIIIQEQSNSTDSLPSFYTTAHEELGTSTDCSTHPPHHLTSQSTPLLECNRHPLPLPVLCVADLVTHLFNAFGTALVFAPTAKKWDIQYTIATSYDETSSVSILTCYTA